MRTGPNLTFVRCTTMYYCYIVMGKGLTLALLCCYAYCYERNFAKLLILFTILVLLHCYAQKRV